MDRLDSFIDHMSDYVSSDLSKADYLGKYGEDLTEEELNKVVGLGYDGKILRNLYLSDEEENSAEIDLLFICRKGFIVLESKNYTGDIYGNERDTEWTATLPDGRESQFNNPVRQNELHILRLRGIFLPEYGIAAFDIPMYSIIVFSERLYLDDIRVSEPDTYVVNRNELKDAITDIWKRSDDFDENKIDEMYGKFLPYY